MSDALTPPPTFREQCETIGLSLTDAEVARLGRFLRRSFLGVNPEARDRRRFAARG